MTRALISIGVNRAGNLTHLSGAVSGARAVADWAMAQGAYAKLFEDDSAPVLFQQIFDEVSNLVEAKTLDHLCIYFAGHGFLTGPGAEVWYLSGAPRNSREAIDVNASVSMARGCGIPHVTFISDACRLPPSSLETANATGGAIFPNEMIEEPAVEVDQFFATKPGGAAYEPRVALDCNGLFTQELLKAIRDPLGNGLSLGDLGGQGVLTCREAKRFLTVAVPIAIRRVSIKYKQKPEIRVESDLPLYLGHYRDHGPADADPSLFPVPVEGMKRLPQLDHIQAQATGASVNISEGKLRPTDVHLPFPPGVAFQVIGDLDKDLLALMTESWQIERNRAYIRGSGESRPHEPMMLPTQVGLVPLVEIPGYVGTIYADRKGPVEVWYEPQNHSQREQEWVVVQDLRKKITRRLKRGTLDATFLKSQAFAGQIRQLKSFDPMLGIVAAYIYAEGGKRDMIQSVRSYMQRDLGAVEIFDIAMLARLFTPSDRTSVKMASSFPMLTRGWAYFNTLSEYERYGWMEKALIPGIWTQFDPARLEQNMPRGFVRWW